MRKSRYKGAANCHKDVAGRHTLKYLTFTMPIETAEGPEAEKRSADLESDEKWPVAAVSSADDDTSEAQVESKVAETRCEHLLLPRSLWRLRIAR